MTVDRPAGVGLPTIDLPDEPVLPTSALVREAIDTALDSLDALERQARDVARRFRRQSVGEAQLGLAQLVQSTQTLLRLADMTATASGTDVDTLCEIECISAPRDTHAAVSHLIREQLAENWTEVAAVLERSFVAALGGWRLVFEVLDPSSGPCGTAA